MLNWYSFGVQGSLMLLGSSYHIVLILRNKTSISDNRNDELTSMYLISALTTW